MPRVEPSPYEHLLTEEQCQERLGIGSDKWAEVKRHPILERGRKAIGSRRRYLASALAKYMHALPADPKWTPPPGWKHLNAHVSAQLEGAAGAAP